MLKFLEELAVAEGVLAMINYFFGLNIPSYIFIIAMFLVLIRRARSYVARSYPKESFLYKRLVTRLVPNAIAITLGIAASDLAIHFEIPRWIRLLFPIIILVIVLASRVKNVSDK